MEASRHLFPAKEHHGHEGALHEESHDTLDSQWGTEDIAHEPGIVAPVGTKLELQDDTRGHTHGEIHAEEALPELGRVFPEVRTLLVVNGLGYAHDNGQAKGQGHEEPVIDCRESELRSGPVNGTGING